MIQIRLMVPPYNVYLVSSYDRHQPVGRPVLYLVTDVYSGMIVGHYVCLESAQYKCAAEALYCAVCDKAEYFGAPDRSGPVYPPSVKGLPAAVCADNAELEGRRIETFAQNHLCRLINTPPYAAERKGTVESSIGRVQFELKGLLKNFTPVKAGIKKAGGVDNRLNGVLTLQEYRRLIGLSVSLANATCRDKIPPGYPADELHAPRDIWQWALAAGRSLLAKVENPLGLRISLLPQEKVTGVSENGINCGGLYYFCTELAAEGWFDRGRRGRRTYCPAVMADPGNVSSAWVFPDKEKHPEKFYACTLAPSSQWLAGCTMAEARMLIESKKLSGQRTQVRHLEERAAKLDDMNSIVAAASAAADAAPADNAGRQEKLAGIRSARRQESCADSASRAIEKPNVQPAGAAPAEDDGDLPDFPDSILDVFRNMPP